MHFNIKSLLAMLTALVVPQLAMAGDVDSGDTADSHVNRAGDRFTGGPGML